ncbi:hypothetical protein BH23GEM8_BH23GEM8_14510 [soil metagenome]
MKPTTPRKCGCAVGVSARLHTLLRVDAGSERCNTHRNLNFSRDRHELFTAKPNNIFLIKANYWVGR